MITDDKERHYLALKSEPMFYNGKLCNRPVKSLSKLLRAYLNYLEENHQIITKIIIV